MTAERLGSDVPGERWVDLTDPRFSNRVELTNVTLGNLRGYLNWRNSADVPVAVRIARQNMRPWSGEQCAFANLLVQRLERLCAEGVMAMTGQEYGRHVLGLMDEWAYGKYDDGTVVSPVVSVYANESVGRYELSRVGLELAISLQQEMFARSFGMFIGRRIYA